MFTIQDLCQQLTCFHPVASALAAPGCPIYQARSGMPITEAPMDLTVYVISPEDISKVPLDSEQILYTIVEEGSKKTGEQLSWNPSKKEACAALKNYVYFSDSVSRTELYHFLQAALTKARRIDDAHHRLSICLMQRDSLEKIMTTAEKILGNPLFLSDTSTRVIKFSDPNALKNADDELIGCVLEHGFVLPEYFEKYDYATLLPLIEKSEHAFLQASQHEGKKERLIAKLNVNRRYFGWIVVFPLYKSFEDGDCEILDILSNVLSLELERNKIGFALSCRENLLMELISGNVASLEEFNRRAESFDWSPGNSFYIMAIGFQEEPSLSSKERIITAYKNHLGLIYPTYKSICIGNILFLLLETEELSPVVSNLEVFLKSNQLCAGCSDHFTNILSFKEYYEQAMNILRLGRRLFPEKRVCLYQELCHYYVASLLEKHGLPKRFCMPQLLELLKSDRECNTCYAQTLRAYIKFRNLVTAAEALHIHRNTMNHRIQKIEEMTGLKLGEGEDLYRLWFSFLIVDLYGIG